MDSNKRRNWTIIGIIAFLAITIGLWLFTNVFSNRNVTYTLKVSPMDATMTLDGKPVKAGTITVSKGKHELSGTRKYFTKNTKQIDTSTDSPANTIFLILGADTDEAQQYIADHEEEQAIREGASDTDITILNDMLAERYPYISKLPYESLDYEIDYETKDKATIALIVTLNPVANPADTESYKAELEEYKDMADQYMRNLGVNMEKTEIKYEPDPSRL